MPADDLHAQGVGCFCGISLDRFDLFMRGSVGRQDGQQKPHRFRPGCGNVVDGNRHGNGTGIVGSPGDGVGGQHTDFFVKEHMRRIHADFCANEHIVPFNNRNFG